MLRLFILLLIITISFISCSEQETYNVQYRQLPEEKLDTYAKYLSNQENFADSTFMPFFYKRFNHLISQDKIDSAAQIVFLTGKNFYKNAIYDSAFVRVSINFLNKYSSKISSRYISGIYSNIGNSYCDIGQYDSSIFYLNKGIIPSKDYYTHQNVAQLNYYLLFCYLSNGKLEQSLNSAFKALEMFENQKDSAFQAATYSGIACIYRYQDDYSEAEKYENKGFKIVKMTRDTNALMTICLNKITLYNQMEHPNLYPFIDSTVKIFRKWSKKTENDILSVDSWYAFKLVHDSKLPEAKKIIDKLRPLALKIVNRATTDYYYNAVAEYDEKTGKPSESIDFYIKKIPELQENEDYLRLILFNQILRSDALLKKDYKAAQKYLEGEKVANDSLTNKTLRIKVKEFDRKYQTEKKEQQIELQKKELTQKNTFIALLIASIISLVTAAAAYSLWQRQKILKQEKESSANFTKQLLKNTEEERKRIAGDLHDSISHELLNLKSALSQDIKAVSNKIDTIINDIRGISRNLHPVMFDKIGLIPNIEQLVERIQNQNNFFVSTEMNYSGSLTSANELQIYRIIQESLSNIIKYANAYAAKITIDENPKNILIEIKDNGKGFNVKEALNGGKAFGLHNIIERSRVIGGEAQINSSTDGTIITINISTKI